MKKGSPINPETVKQAGKEFLQAADDPGAWGVAQQLVTLRGQTTPWYLSVEAAVKRNGFVNCWKLPGPPLAQPDPSQPIFNSRGSDGKPRVTMTPVRILRNCTITIEDEDTVKAMGQFKIRCEGCLVTYTGGVHLIAGRYENCIFIYSPLGPPSSSAVMLAEKILEAPGLIQSGD